MEVIDLTLDSDSDDGAGPATWSRLRRARYAAPICLPEHPTWATLSSRWWLAHVVGASPMAPEGGRGKHRDNAPLPLPAPPITEFRCFFSPFPRNCGPLLTPFGWQSAASGVMPGERGMGMRG